MSNFTILDKNSAPVGSVTKAVLSADKKKVTLTVPALTVAGQPYTLFINKNELPVEDNMLPIDVSLTAPVANDVKVDNATQVTVDFDKDVAEATLGSLAGAGAVTLVDLTDTTLTHTPTATIVGGNVEVGFTGNLVPGHNYKLAIAKDVLVDSFGTKNELVEKTFTVTNNTTVPAATSVQYVKSAVAGEVDAIVTFNIPVVNKAGQVDVKVQDRDGFQTSNTYAADVLDSTATSAVQTARVAGLALANNQLLVQDIGGAGIPLTAGKLYGLVVEQGEVTDTTLAKLENADTTVAANYNIDIVAPTVTATELVSASEIKLTLSEAVTYDTAKEIKVDGFDVDGQSADVVAAVTLSADGKTVTLKPKTTGELFVTDGGSNDLTIAAEAFVDAASNKNASAITVALSGATDKAAPVLVSATYLSSDITLSFTEAVDVTDAAAAKAIVVDGTAVSYSATPGTGWNIAGGDVVINTGSGTSQVSLAAGTVKDGATTANLNASKTVAVTDLTPAPDTTPPVTFAVAAPTTADNGSDGDDESSVTVTWIDSTSTDVDHYEIVAKTGSAPAVTDVVAGQDNIATGTETATFNYTAGDDVHVAVVAVDAAGNKTLATNATPNVTVATDTP